MKAMVTNLFKKSNLLIKIGIISAVFLLIAVFNFIGISYFKIVQEKDAAVVDAAGRQRMLSQKIAFLSERIVKGEKDVKDDLLYAINLCDNSLKSLKEGGVAEGIANNMILPATPTEILPTLLEAENLWIIYKKHALTIIEEVHEPSIAKDKITVEPIKQAHEVEKVRLASIIFIEQHADKMLQQFNNLVQKYVANNIEKQSHLDYLLIFFLLVNAVFSLFVLVVTNKYIRMPILHIKACIEELSEGRLNNSYDYSSADELGSLVKRLKRLESNLEEASLFATHIGLNKFDSFFEAKSKDDQLGNALLKMRAQLIEFNHEETKRKWVAEGLAKFSKIIQMYQRNFEELTNEILSELVKYVNANQGALYVVNDNNKEDVFLEMMSCYAWNRKKHMNRNIYKGEGIVGEVWAEKSSVYLTNIPSEYITITSGLGEATPRCIYILPLIANDTVQGVIEFAFFKELVVHKKAFLERLSESIASTVYHTKTAQKTKKLLHQSQCDAEEMKVNAEEMRQNIEELDATQEEMLRNQQRLKESEIRNKLFFDNTSCGILGVSKEGKIIDANPASAKILETPAVILKGGTLDDFIKDFPFATFNAHLGVYKEVSVSENKKIRVLLNRTETAANSEDIYVVYLNQLVSKECV